MIAVNWNEWALVASAVFVAFAISALIIEMTRSRFKMLTARNVLIAGTFISSCIVLFPVYWRQISAFTSVLMSVQHAIRLFAFDNRFFDLIDHAEGITDFYMFILA